MGPTAKAREITLQEAALAYAAAKAAVDKHEGPYRGPEYAQLLGVWRAALLELESAAQRAANAKG